MRLHQARITALGLLLAPVAIPALAAEPPPAPASRSGPALRAGHGVDYAGYGVQALYYQRLGGSLFAIAPSVSFGVRGAVYAGNRVVEDEVYLVKGLTAGLAASYGERHRVSLSVGYGSVGTLEYPVQNLIVDSVGVYAPFAELGYELVTDRGFIARICPLGIAYHTSRFLPPSSARWEWVPSVGAGWKIW